MSKRSSRRRKQRLARCSPVDRKKNALRELVSMQRQLGLEIQRALTELGIVGETTELQRFNEVARLWSEVSEVIVKREVTDKGISFDLEVITPESIAASDEEARELSDKINKLIMPALERYAPHDAAFWHEWLKP